MGLFADALLLPDRLRDIAMIARQQQTGLVLNVIDGDSNVFNSAEGRNWGTQIAPQSIDIPIIASPFFSACDGHLSGVPRGSFATMFPNTVREAFSAAPAAWQPFLHNWYTAPNQVDSTEPVFHNSNRDGEQRGLNVTPRSPGFVASSSPNRFPICTTGDQLACDTWYLDGPGGGSFYAGRMRYDVAPYTEIAQGTLVACNTEESVTLKRHRKNYTVAAGDLDKTLGFHTCDSNAARPIVAPVAILGQQLSVHGRYSGFSFDTMVAVGGQPLSYHIGQLKKSGFMAHARRKVEIHKRLADERGIPFHVLVNYQGGPNDRNASSNSVGPRAGIAGFGQTGDGYYDNLVEYYMWYKEMLSGIPGFDFDTQFRLHLQIAPWASNVGASDTTQDAYRTASYTFAKRFDGVVYCETKRIWRSYDEAQAYKIDADHMNGHGQVVTMTRFWQEVLDANPV